jgi:5-methyltetrahydrofolate--homocysteine methyltransferase
MDITTIYKAVVEGNAPAVEAGVKQALDDKTGPEVILNEALISAMNEVGKRFQNGIFFVPEMLIAARAMKTGVAILKPLFVESGIEPLGKVVLGTVFGDMHDIGKNLVGLMLEGAGFEVIDIGVDIPAEDFVAAVKRDNPHVLGLSALLTTTMPSIGDVIKALQEANLRDGLTVVVGGACLTEDLAMQLGADGYASDAASAVDKVKELTGLGN